jgi:hypothetical protein
MSRDLESNYTEDYNNEEKHCRYCDSFAVENGKNICHEQKMEVPANAHCDFFRSKD